MSYREDMQFFREDSAAFRQKIFLAVKVTAALFALVAILLSVFLVIDISRGAGWDNGGDVGGDQGGVSGADNKAPTISGPADNTIYVSIGETVAYKSAVTVTDDSGKYTLDIITNTVNADKAGTYSITYVAKDAAGNTSKLTVKVVVSKSDYTYEMLKAVVEKLIPKLNISANMSTAEKVRKIYEYVNDPTKTGANARIYFSDESNIPNIDRSNWETDWIEEAYRTLKPLADGNAKTEGDCYSYYAASKAFFAYYGIDNKGIKRNENESNMSGTHFWSMVNIGTESAPQWYFYDATRLAGSFSDGSNECCLRTLAELTSYKASQTGQYGFYAFNSTGYPTASTKSIDFN